MLDDMEFKKEEILEIEFSEIVENNDLEPFFNDETNKNIKLLEFINDDVGQSGIIEEYQLVDLTPLLKLPKLIALLIEPGFEFSCKSNLENIKELRLISTYDPSHSFLKLFPNIEKLGLDDRSHAEFDLGYFSKLKNLTLDYDYTFKKYEANFKNLAQLKNLKLNLSNSLIPKFSLIKKITYDMKSLLPLKELENLKVVNELARGVEGWPDIEVDFSSIFELTKLEYTYIKFTVVICSLPIQVSTKNSKKDDGEYYDYEIIKDYDINNERRYTILTGGEEVEKLTIYPDKS